VYFYNITISLIKHSQPVTVTASAQDLAA